MSTQILIDALKQISNGVRPYYTAQYVARAALTKYELTTKMSDLDIALETDGFAVDNTFIDAQNFVKKFSASVQGFQLNEISVFKNKEDINIGLWKLTITAPFVTPEMSEWVSKTKLIFNQNQDGLFIYFQIKKETGKESVFLTKSTKGDEK